MSTWWVHKISAFGANGVSVNMGATEKIRARFRNEIGEHALSSHCLPHRLELLLLLLFTTNVENLFQSQKQVGAEGYMGRVKLHSTKPFSSKNLVLVGTHISSTFCFSPFKLCNRPGAVYCCASSHGAHYSHIQKYRHKGKGQTHCSAKGKLVF